MYTDEIEEKPVSTDELPQIDKLREYILRGIAAMFPRSSNASIGRWMVVQKLIINPNVVLSVYDDLITEGYIRRQFFTPENCGCSRMEIYRLTDKGLEKLKEIL